MGIIILFYAVIVAGATMVAHVVWSLAYFVVSRILNVSLPFFLTWTGVSLLSFVSLKGWLVRLWSADAKSQQVLWPFVFGALVLATVVCWIGGLAGLGILKLAGFAIAKVFNLGGGGGAGPFSLRALVAYGAYALLLGSFLRSEAAFKRNAEEVVRKAASDDAEVGRAVKSEDAAALRRLVASDPRWDRAYESLGKWRPMEWAIAQDRPGLVTLLLDLPAPAGPAQARYLPQAVAAGNAGIATLLLDRGANPNGDALEAACKTASRPMIDLLLARGADPKVEARNVLIGAIDGKDPSILALMLDKGADPNAGRGENLPALSYAAFHDEGPFLGILLAHGADPNIPDGWETRPLAHAISFGNEAGLRFLLAHGANPSLPDKTGKTPLMCAVDKGQIDLVKVLLEAKTDLSVRTKDDFSRTALGIAKMRQNPEMVALLETAHAPE